MNNQADKAAGVPSALNVGLGVTNEMVDRFINFAESATYLHHSAKLTNWAINHGYGEHWTCYSKISWEESAGDG